MSSTAYIFEKIVHPFRPGEQIPAPNSDCAEEHVGLIHHFPRLVAKILCHGK